MSSSLFIVNWTASAITPTLNGTQLPSIPTSKASENYFPYDISVPRTTGTSQPGIWGTLNNFQVTLTESSKTEVYNSLADPKCAKPNIALMMWVFPDNVVFSQIGERLSTVTPTG